MKLIKIQYNNKPYNVLFAKTQSETSSGMSIYSTPPNHGMFFILTNPGFLNMRAMLFPLFVVFFDFYLNTLSSGVFYPGTSHKMPDKTYYMLELPLHII